MIKAYIYSNLNYLFKLIFMLYIMNVLSILNLIFGSLVNGVKKG